jgi:hypothetical protein
MSNLLGSRHVVHSVRQYVEDNVQAAIDEVNDFENVLSPLETPVAVKPFVPTKAYLDAGMPMMGIQHGRLMVEDDSGWGFTAKMPLTLVVFDMSYDQDELSDKMMLWQSVMAKVMLPVDRVITNEAWPVQFVSADPGPTLTRSENPRDYYSLTTLTVTVRFTEEA